MPFKGLKLVDPDIVYTSSSTTTGNELSTGSAVIRAGVAADIPLTVRGTTSQSGNLLVCENVSGTDLVKVSSAGNVDIVSGTLDVGGAATFDSTVTVTGASQCNSTLSVGVDDTGYDVNFFGATSGKKFFWDESADTAFLTCTVDIDGIVTVGVDDTGYDVTFFGATTGKSWLWDESADTMIVTGTSTLAGNTGITGTATVTSSNGSALAVGRQGATAPALKVDASTGSSATGIEIVAAAAAGGVALRAISSGTDEALTINAKGTGTIGIGSVSTGAVTITPATTVTGALTATAGVQSSAVAVTATADGLTTGIIPAGAAFVSITSAAATNMVSLPTAVVGNIIHMWVGANGCELCSAIGSNATINTVDADGTNQTDIPATTLIIAVCVAAATWVVYAVDELGAAIAALVPDND